MHWWVWVLLGFVLLVVEMMTPSGFYFLFFGLAGVCVGALALAGVVTSTAQPVVFAVLSFVSMLAFRKALARRFVRGRSSGATVDAIEGELAKLEQDLAPGQAGKAEFRGSTWTARNGSSATLRASDRVRIARVDGLTLVVGPQ